MAGKFRALSPIVRQRQSIPVRETVPTEIRAFVDPPKVPLQVSVAEMHNHSARAGLAGFCRGRFDELKQLAAYWSAGKAGDIGRRPDNAPLRPKAGMMTQSGARGETRTLTPAKAGDFESPASTIPPLGHLPPFILHDFLSPYGPLSFSAGPHSSELSP